MKKLLSVLVILCMVSSLLCVPTFATETNTNAVRYEFEDYCTYKSSSSGAEVKNNNYASKGTYLRDLLSSQARTITIDVPIEEAGYYFIRYVASDYLTSGASKLDFMLDNAKLGNNYTKSKNVLTEGTVITEWPGYANAFEMRKYEKIQYLDASTHQFTVEAAKKNYYLDYVEFEYIPTPVMGEGTTRVEPEYYAPSGIRVLSTVADNGYFIFKNEAPISYEPSFDFDVIVEKSGFYNITYLAGYKAAKNISNITLKLGDEIIGTNDNTYKEAAAVYNSSYNTGMPMSKYEKEMVWIEKGDYSLSVDFEEVSSTDTTKTYCFQLDYIDFEYVSTPSVSSKSATKVEFETYAKDYKKSSQIASGGAYIGGEYGGKTDPATVSFVVDVEEAGYYNVTYLLGYRTESSASVVTLKVGDDVIGKNTDTDYKEQFAGFTYDSLMPMSKYKKEMIYLSEGEKTIEAIVDVAPGDKYVFQLDYIEFEYVPTPTVSSKETKRIEFESYAKGFKQTNSGIASGGAYIRSVGTTKDPSFTFEIDVLEEGYYNVTYLAGYAVSPGISNVTIKVGDSLVGTNAAKTNGRETVEGFYDDVWNTNHMPMSKFVKKNLWLCEGTNTVSVEIAPSSDENYKFQLDYIEFEAAGVNNIAVEEGAIGAEVYYKEAVSGTPVMALYNGNKLVSVEIFDSVENTTSLTLNFEETNAFDKVKIFVLGDTVSIAPQVETVEFEIK